MSSFSFSFDLWTEESREHKLDHDVRRVSQKICTPPIQARDFTFALTARPESPLNDDHIDESSPFLITDTSDVSESDTSRLSMDSQATLIDDEPCETTLPKITAGGSASVASVRHSDLRAPERGWDEITSNPRASDLAAREDELGDLLLQWQLEMDQLARQTALARNFQPRTSAPSLRRAQPAQPDVISPTSYARARMSPPSYSDKTLHSDGQIDSPSQSTFPFFNLFSRFVTLR